MSSFVDGIGFTKLRVFVLHRLNQNSVHEFDYTDREISFTDTPFLERVLFIDSF